MNAEELKTRLKLFAYRTINMCEALPAKYAAEVISKQVIRSSFSAAANYQAATRAQSKKQFLAKVNIALEEIDESLFWIEAVKDLKLLKENKLTSLLNEALELVKILSATKKYYRYESEGQNDKKIINHIS